MLADLVAGEYSQDGVSDDPDDDKYIAAFVEGRASFVVTGDPPTCWRLRNTRILVS